MRHRELLRPLPPIKQMHRVQEPKHALQPEYRGTFPWWYPLTLCALYKVGLQGQIPRGWDLQTRVPPRGTSEARLEPYFSLSPPV